MIPTPEATYAETVTTTAPVAPAGSPRAARSRWSRMWHNLGRDTRLVAPGFFISLAAVIVLVVLLTLSVGTAVIWVGVLLLPVTLLVATAFANLSRRRATRWGAPIAEVTNRPRARGLRGWLGIVAEGRRWTDLLFESVFALPVRIVTFSVAVSWFVGALGGLSYFYWGRFLPDDGSGLLNLIVADWNRAPIVDLGFSAEATFQFAAGLVLLVTFPFVLHAMARLEIAAVTAGLAPRPAEATVTSQQTPAHATTVGAGDAWGPAGSVSAAGAAAPAASFTATEATPAVPTSAGFASATVGAAR